MEGEAQAVVQGLMTLISTWGLRVVGAIALLIVGRMVAGSIRKTVRKVMTRSQADDTLKPFVASMSYYLVLTVVVIAVLGVFGIPTASLIAVLGAAGLAVGLALQGSLSNFAAGVMLLIFRPFRVGDFIDAGGVTGAVKEIGIFSTTLSSPDNKKIIVPNSVAFGGTITNFTCNDTRRVDMVMGISYSDDIGTALKTIQEIVTAHPAVLADPEPKIAVSNLGASSVDIIVRPWCKTEDYWTVWFDLTHQLKEGIEAAGCSFPFPQQDVHLFKEGEA